MDLKKKYLKINLKHILEPIQVHNTHRAERTERILGDPLKRRCGCVCAELGIRPYRGDAFRGSAHGAERMSRLKKG